MTRADCVTCVTKKLTQIAPQITPHVQKGFAKTRQACRSARPSREHAKGGPGGRGLGEGSCSVIGNSVHYRRGHLRYSEVFPPLRHIPLNLPAISVTSGYLWRPIVPPQYSTLRPPIWVNLSTPSSPMPPGSSRWHLPALCLARLSRGLKERWRESTTPDVVKLQRLPATLVSGRTGLRLHFLSHSILTFLAEASLPVPGISTLLPGTTFNPALCFQN